MKISATKIGDGNFNLAFDDTEVTLDAQDLKVLLLQVTQVLAPGSGVAKDALRRSRRFLGRLKEANDVDIQVFMQVADHDDVVVLLKAAESDSDVLQKLFRNMSENSRKMFVEDMEFRFKEDVTDGEIASTLDRLNRTADQLRSEGRTDL